MGPEHEALAGTIARHLKPAAGVADPDPHLPAILLFGVPWPDVKKVHEQAGHVPLRESYLPDIERWDILDIDGQVRRAPMPILLAGQDLRDRLVGIDTAQPQCPVCEPLFSPSPTENDRRIRCRDCFIDHVPIGPQSR